MAAPPSFSLSSSCAHLAPTPLLPLLLCLVCLPAAGPCEVPAAGLSLLAPGAPCGPQDPLWWTDPFEDPPPLPQASQTPVLERAGGSGGLRLARPVSTGGLVLGGGKEPHRGRFPPPPVFCPFHPLAAVLLPRDKRRWVELSQLYPTRCSGGQPPALSRGSGPHAEAFRGRGKLAVLVNGKASDPRTSITWWSEVPSGSRRPSRRGGRRRRAPGTPGPRARRPR